MRFAAVTVALFAGLAAALPNGAESTVYQTEEVTITSCAPTVTNCPGRHTETGVSVAPTAVATNSVPTGGVSPVGSSSVSSHPVPVPTGVNPVPAGPSPSTTVVPVVHTTCAAVTSWSTIVNVPTASSPVGGSSGSSHVPSSVAAASSATAKPSSTPAFNGAGALSGSLGFAGAAAVAAFFLA